MADGLKKFGSMSWDEIKRGLTGMGGALAEVSVAIGALGKIAGFSVAQDYISDIIGYPGQTFGRGGGTRTRTGFRPRVPEARASAIPPRPGVIN